MTDDHKQGEAPDTNAAFNQQLTNNSSVSWNVGQNGIVTTEDKLRLCIIDYSDKLSKRDAWMTPTGVFITIMVALVTSDFKDLGLAKATWQAVFVIGAIISAFMSVKQILASYRTSCSHDELIESIKTSSKRQ